MRNNSLFPPAIIAFAEVKKISTVLKAAKDFQNEQDYLHYLTHDVNNVVHKDGRIYMQLGEDGKLYANSVSPFSSNFWNNIEPKIKPLLKVLVEKRYLPYSSCEGHGSTFRRYVGLAFADESSRDYVANYIVNKKIPGVKLNFLDSVCNQKIDLTNKRSVKYSDKYDPKEVEQKESEIKSFNVQFHRKYTQYFFLEIIILDAVVFDFKALKNPCETLWLLYMKKFKWDKITKQLTSALESIDFRKYKF